MKFSNQLIFFIILLLAELSQSQSPSYIKANTSCLLLTPAKRKCLLPSYRKYCCQNCNDLQINCQGVTRHKQIFFLAKFIDCPEGVVVCRIANQESILNSEWIQTFFKDEKDIDILTNIIEFQAIECEKDYILLGNMCIKRENCSQVGVYYQKIYCSKCDDGYFLSGDSMNSCKKCKSYMYLNSLKDEIIETTDLCLECNDQNNCTKCIDGYNLFYDYNHGKYICIKCQDNCRCSSEDPCINCTKLYYYKRSYFSKDDGDGEAIPLYQSCESCITFIEEHLGPNLKQLIQIYNLQIEDLVESCKGLSLQSIELLNIEVKDIIEQTFTINIYKIKGMFETCPEGCANCQFSEVKQDLQCIICLNGYYFDYFKKNPCQSCSSINPEYQLCIVKKVDSGNIKIYPTQCKTYFNQPVLGQPDQIFDCTIQPTCILADQWTHQNKISKGSCKICLFGYKKELLVPDFNYYKCEQIQSTNTITGEFQKCQNGFYNDFHTNSCKPCPKHCLSCTSEGCEQCDNTKTYSNILSSNFLECIVLQSQTSDVTNCMIFQQGKLNSSSSSYLQKPRPIGGFCKKCKNGFEEIYQRTQGIDVIVECKMLIDNCISIQAEKYEIMDPENKHNIVCTQCEFGYYLNNKTCQKIPNNCALFDSFLQKCLHCKYGYQLERNECIQCTNIKSINQIGYFKCLSTIQEIQLMNISYIYSRV